MGMPKRFYLLGNKRINPKENITSTIKLNNNKTLLLVRKSSHLCVDKFSDSCVL